MTSFLRHERTVTVYSQGVNQSSAGTDKVNAIINCHLATGRIGRPGMGPFSVTGQPNAMGGREVGGLANMLAAHMDLDNARHRDLVQRYWKAPRMAAKPGLKAVDLFRAVGEGRIKALWIMATNPVDSIPEADDVRSALQRCPFVVVSDITLETDTSSLRGRASALAWLGRKGRHGHELRAAHFTPAFVPAGARRSARRLVADGGSGQAPGVREPHFPTGTQRRFSRNMPGFRPSRTRDRALSTSAHMPVSRPGDYEELEPFQWPQPSGQPTRVTRLFGEWRIFHSLTERGASFQRPGARRHQKRRVPFRSCSILAGFAINGTP